MRVETQDFASLQYGYIDILPGDGVAVAVSHLKPR